MEDERLRKVSSLQSFVSRPELGSVFGLAIIVVTFMSLTTVSGTFSAMWTNPIGIQAWVEAGGICWYFSYWRFFTNDSW